MSGRIVPAPILHVKEMQLARKVEVNFLEGIGMNEWNEYNFSIVDDSVYQGN